MSEVPAPNFEGPNPREIRQRIEDGTWQTISSCREYEPGLFFPVDGVGEEVAKQICRTCVVVEPCLNYALDNRIDDGVWGGASERERRRILQRRFRNR